MNRVTQNLLLTLLGGAVLRISAFSTTYLNYVKPGFRPFLISTGVVLVALGVIGLLQASRTKESPARDDTPPPRDQTLNSFTPLTGTGPVEMTVGDFIGRAWDDDKKSLTGREVKLTGFVSPAKKKGQWYVTRMQIACCAADAFPLKVAVRGLQAPPADTWVEVTGTWIPQTFGTMTTGVVYPQMTGKSLTRIDPPDEQTSNAQDHGGRGERLRGAQGGSREAGCHPGPRSTGPAAVSEG
ncbi:TIGR03943 family putative permease subunit [Streptosporangium sp. H16]|uniref:TIGR03943 family putative permease subunit n=1 Tax=Streptosporangium sp. H16 TaxID=3444184 RepID=UPI003F7983A4